MNRVSFLIIVIFSVLIASCDQKNKNSLPGDMDNTIYHMAKGYFIPMPELDLKSLSPDRKAMIKLGKKLFFDKRLSRNKNVNCASCHKIEKFGVDNLRISPGDEGQTGVRNTPSVFNAHLQYAQFWSAHARTVEEQSAGPIFGSFEMRMPDTLTLVTRLGSDKELIELFREAFPNADTLITIETIKIAIGAFERTLQTPGKFDDYLKGDLNALTAAEKLGIKAFVDNGCIPCHSSTLVGGQMAQKFALYGYYWDYTNSSYIDKGRFEKTEDPGEKFVFKVPQLRNIGMTYPYFHDGSIDSLEEAIKIMGMSESNIQLKDEDVNNIAAFLRALTGNIPDHAYENNEIIFE